MNPVRSASRPNSSVCSAEECAMMRTGSGKAGSHSEPFSLHGANEAGETIRHRIAGRISEHPPTSEDPEMSKHAATDHPVHELIASRWSPYAFANRPVAREDLLSLFEAARWAPSSYNEQPWTYLVATRDDAEEFAKVLSCLVEGNRVWAQAAPVLALGCTSLNFVRNGKPNAAAVHDLGLGSANLVLEATARGLAVHQMIGILPDRVREVYQVPEGVQPLTGLAIGYVGDPAGLPENLRVRDTTPRSRKPLSAFVFGSKWGTTSPVVG